MKTVGKEVLKINTTLENTRNGEGTFARLDSGDILFAYTKFDVSQHDHGSACIAACVSHDEGETWGEPFVMIEKDDGAQNIMSPSFVMLDGGALGIVYLRKEKRGMENTLYCMPVFRSSRDGGKTWSEPAYMTDDPSYYVVVNDSVIRQKNGRILVPVSRAGNGHYEYFAGNTFFLYSDDLGKTWQRSDVTIVSPYEDKIGLQEPGVYEYENGDLWVWFRTGYGFQYQSFSHDGANTFTSPAPNFHFTSPDSPMRVKKVGALTVAVFNPLPYNCMREDVEKWHSPKRTPLVCAVSRDDGRSFDTTGKAASGTSLDGFAPNVYLIEGDTRDSYCYPAIIETKDGFLVSYYHSAGTDMCLNITKMTKIYFDELK
ncbi:MAG: exo-alpha-sialidase [Clostridiales bacterium]|nr:exo-alpha-sialidase [Clostridiales bacterium]